MTLAQGAQGAGEFGIEGDFDAVAAVVLQRWTRAVGGQFQQRRGTLQMLAPEAQLALQQRAFEPATLPLGVVGVLDRQRRQRIGLAQSEGGIQGAEFAHQQAHGPAIGDDVVHGEQQTMLMRVQAQQAAADQRSMFQIEGSAGFLFGMALGIGVRIC